jgi:hypothetical protein
MGGVEALTPQQGADATRLLLGFIGLGEDTLLILCIEAASLGSGHDLGVGAANAQISAGRAPLSGQGDGNHFRVFHAEYPSRPAL